jgi:hypothetical protein
MEGYCACEKRVIELENHPRLKVLEYQAYALLEEEAQLVERLRQAPPPGSLCSRRVRAAVYYALTALLIVAGGYFAFMSLQPFRLGIKALIYCAAVAVLTPFLVHFVLRQCDAERLIKWRRLLPAWRQSRASCSLRSSGVTCSCRNSRP